MQMGWKYINQPAISEVPKKIRSFDCKQLWMKKSCAQNNPNSLIIYNKYLQHVI